MTILSGMLRSAIQGFSSIGICFMLTLALAACNAPAEPLPSEMPPTATPHGTSISPSRTPAPTPFTETPENASISLNKMEPFITPDALRVRFDSWSLDGLWIAYWHAENEEQPASLAFANVASGQTCQAEEVQAQSLGSDLLHWQEDGSVIIFPGGSSGVPLKGMPCEVFVPTEESARSDPKTSTYLSPDGRYLATERIIRQEEAVFHIELQITELAAGQNLLTLSYLGSPHLIFGGPRWLNNDIYVIGKTVDQGALYYSILEDRVAHLYPDLLGLETEKDFAFFTQTDPKVGMFHVLLLSDGPALLYHSESNQLEELTLTDAVNFADASGGLSYFSPDGKWLLLNQTVGRSYWLHPVDPPRSTPTELASYGRASGLSPDGQKLALAQGNRAINIVRFPAWALSSRWTVAGFDLQGLWWSPDSQRLVAWGMNPNSGKEALFLIQAP